MKVPFSFNSADFAEKSVLPYHSFVHAEKPLAETMGYKIPEKPSAFADKVYSFALGGGMKGHQRWLIKKLIPETSIGFITADSGVGKTFLVLDIALSIAVQNKSWAGFKICKQGPVIYLGGEGTDSLNERLLAWTKMKNLGDHIPENFLSLNMEASNGLDALINQETTPILIQSIMQLKLETPPVLLIIDTLNCFFDGEENSAKETGAFISLLRTLRDTFHCAVVVLHHTTKQKRDEDGKRTSYRGSSALRGAADFNFVLTKDFDTKKAYWRQTGKPCEALVMELEKSKSTQSGTRFGMIFESVYLGKDEDGDPIYSLAMSGEPHLLEDKPEEDHDSPLESLKAKLRGAFREYGKTEGGDKFFINRQDFIKYLVDNGSTKEDADNYCKKTNAEFKAGLEAGILEPERVGKSVRYNLIIRSENPDCFKKEELDPLLATKDPEEKTTEAEESPGEEEVIDCTDD